MKPKCAYCGGPIPGQLEAEGGGRRRKYCSKDCSRDAWRQRNGMVGPPKRDDCKQCGTPLVHEHRAGRPKEYCDYKCRRRFNDAKRAGERARLLHEAREAQEARRRITE